jgi:hypothetical protein
LVGRARDGGVGLPGNDARSTKPPGASVSFDTREGAMV